MVILCDDYMITLVTCQLIFDNFGNLRCYVQKQGGLLVFIDTFSALCNDRKITMNKACLEIGISRTATAKWKNGSTPNGQTLAKIADYFGVSVGYLLGHETEKAPTEADERKNKGDEIMFALSRGGEGEITDAMFNEVKSFAEYVAQREAKKNEK